MAEFKMPEKEREFLNSLNDAFVSTVSTKKPWNEVYKVHVEVIGHEQQADGFVIKFASVAFNKATAEMTRREFTRKILASEVLPEGHEFEGR